MNEFRIPAEAWVARTPRTRCDPGQGPLWCLVMGGPSADLYHAATLAALQDLRRQGRDL